MVDVARVRETRQFGKPHAIRKMLHSLGCSLKGKPRLSGPAHASQRDQPARTETLDGLRQFLLTAHEGGQLDRQVVEVSVEGPQWREAFGEARVDQLRDRLGLT